MLSLEMQIDVLLELQEHQWTRSFWQADELANVEPGSRL